MYYLKSIDTLEEEKLIRFLNNRSSAQEQEEVSHWLNHPFAEEAIRAFFQQTWAKPCSPEPGDEARYEKMLNRIHDATTPKGKRLTLNKKWARWARMAASYLLPLISCYFLFQLWINPDIPKVQEEKAMYKKTTGAGEKKKIRLPDQSIVILNALSTIRYDADFSVANRLIYLEGEAYFEVTPNKDLPFIVQTNGVCTTALGTAFNAASKNGKVVITLTEGKVMVNYDRDKLTLQPGQTAVYEPGREQGLKLGDFDPAFVTAWKEGKIAFKSKSLGEILTNLEAWYGVEFSTAAGLDLERKVTGIFDNSNLEDIMVGLSFSLDLVYTVNGNHVTVQSSKPMK